MFEGIIYSGGPIDDVEMFALLPTELQDLLRDVNGFIALRGGLHIRGASRGPYWHSFRHAMLSPQSFATLYESVAPSDIPFAQDCVGDQFLLRDGVVWHLDAETGDVESLDLDFESFLAAAASDPVEFLSTYPLLQLEAEGGHLEPGQLVHAYPPFCTKQSGQGVSLRAIPASEVIAFHAEFAQTIKGVPDGGRIIVRVEQ